MPRRSRRLLIAALLLVAAAAAPLGAAAGAASSASRSPSAAAPTRLDRFLEGLRTWSAEFTQTLTDSRGRRLEAVRGTLQVARPGRFRWEVRPAAAAPGSAAAVSEVPTQIMVADGRNVWFYDRELEQVTVKGAGSALSATPAMLLSGGVDLAANFLMTPLPRSGGLEWVRVRPRRSDAEFREARLGFSATQLQRIELEDRLGQTARIDFANSERNVPIPEELLRFEPPPGVDVIGRPAAAPAR